jgi:hypothetical protein
MSIHLCRNIVATFVFVKNANISEVELAKIDESSVPNIGPKSLTYLPDFLHPGTMWYTYPRMKLLCLHLWNGYEILQSGMKLLCLHFWTGYEFSYSGMKPTSAFYFHSDRSGWGSTRTSCAEGPTNVRYVGLRPILNFAPRGKLWPPGVKLSPRGEVVP